MPFTSMASLLRCAVLLSGLALFAPGATAQKPHIEPRAAKTSEILQGLTHNQTALTYWLRQMPKGGDLHNHLVGAIYAENLLGWAAEDGLCVDPDARAIIAQPECASPLLPAKEAIQQPELYEKMLQSLSMRDFGQSADGGSPAGHAQFFSTFDRFMPATMNRDGDMLAEVAERAAANGVLYLELMHSPGMFEAAAGAPGGMGEDWAAQWQADKNRLEGIAKQVTKQMDEAHARMRTILACDTPAKARPGCKVEIRFLAQVVRVFPSANQVFAQSALGFMLVQNDPRFVGINLVGPEHSQVALRDYTLHMQQLHWLKDRWPQVAIALHAGELNWGLVAPERMRSHIRQAIEIAGAQRIGHGVAIAHEDNATELLEKMKRDRIAVEINLTSNDVILGVRGQAHPMKWYMDAGVPVVLSTDDEGVSRIDLTHEYLRAMTDQGLDYLQLKQIARNSLTHAFLPGQSLWQIEVDKMQVAPACAQLQSETCIQWTKQNPKAKLQWNLEERFAAFEDAVLKKLGEK